MGNEIKNGTIINGRYEITQKIGSGGMADVYKARCNKLGRYVAIKFLKEEFAADREFVDRFEAEARASAGITHANIVSVYDFGESDGRKYIVMEYVEGITLKEYIAHHGKLTWREAASVAGQICSGLACAHKSGIIHRDIKPQNIILTKTGIAKVADFGIARIASHSTIVKADNRSIIGSAHYFSPEQAVGGDVDKTTDIYSLGVVLFEMLTGVVPFDSTNPISLSVMHSQSPVPPIENYTQGVPEDLKKVVYKAMSKNRLDRYSSAEEMLSDIKSILKGMPPVYADPKKKRENKIAGAADTKNTRLINTICITVIAIVAVIIITLTISSVVSWGRNSKDSTDSSDAAVENTDENGDNNDNSDDNGDEDAEEKDVPDVLHNKEDAARKTLSDAGFKVKIETKQTDDANEIGTVVEQNPSAGDKAKTNSTVTIYIGTKKENSDEISVSKVTGMTEAEASVLFENLFKVNIEYEDLSEEDKDKDGTVISQKPSPGQKLKKGNTIELVVGRYKEKQPEPSASANPSHQTKERTQEVSVSVPSDGEAEKWVRVKVNGSDVLNKTYSAGQNVSVNVNIREGETKQVEFYINEKLYKTEEVTY